MDFKILEKVNSPGDLRKLSKKELNVYAEEVRQYIIDNVSETGGHLASNLGVVELTIALHRVFSTPEDKIIWDVGHQSYVHKIITGRRDKFSTLRQKDGLSGFPKSSESEHDSFNTGHSSTSISAAVGMAAARDIKGEKNNIVAVIGDGALTGGMAFEALNNSIGKIKGEFVVVLNDNEMSITQSVGGISKYLGRIRTKQLYYKFKWDIEILLGKIPFIGKPLRKCIYKLKEVIKRMFLEESLFEQLGFRYIGPVDGHDINEVTKVLRHARRVNAPTVVHVCTKKGKGYSFAEERPCDFHGIAPFEVETGETYGGVKSNYSKVFGNKLVDIADRDDSVVAITAAMIEGTGLVNFSKKYPERTFDVGIAEQHAVTFAAGLAKEGMKPVFAVYSTFLQRGYDQVLHDVALQDLHVVFAIDRAGVVGADGETHHGLYDLSYLIHIPNMILCAPSSFNELEEMLELGVMNNKHPYGIRYPRGGCEAEFESKNKVEIGKGEIVKEGNDVTVISVGTMLINVLEMNEILEKENISCEIINIRYVKPFDESLVLNSVKKTGRLVVVEDGTIIGGFGSFLLEFLSEKNVKVITKLAAFPDEIIRHATNKQLYEKYNLDGVSLAKDIKEWIGE